MTDIVEQLRDKAFRACGPTMEAVHTKRIEWKAADTIDALRAALRESQQHFMRVDLENARLREALSGLNAAIDAFWNDKTRPSIAHMNDQTLLKVEAAQRAARAAMGESDE